MIKVCGLRRTEDIDYVNALKPDYIGFIFAKSRRRITTQEAINLKHILDENIKTVGIFVNEEIENVLDIAKSVNLDVVQLHGDENQEYIEELKLGFKTQKIKPEIWKAIRVKNKESLKKIELLEVDGILLDTYSSEAYGGLGESFDWRIVKDLKLDKKIILAGGLNIENVELAKNIVKPDIIDVSSGVEIDGFKDYEKMKIFIERGR